MPRQRRFAAALLTAALHEKARKTGWSVSAPKERRTLLLPQERPAQKTDEPSRERRASKRACPLFQTDLPESLRLPQSLSDIAG